MNRRNDGLPRIWAVHDGVKIDRDDIGHALALGNSVWDGEAIRVFGARNEVIAFQVMVEAHDRIHTLSASLPELTHHDGHSRIVYAPPAGDPTEYVGRPIQLFGVHYMHVDQPTEAPWIVGRNRSTDHVRTGWKPVQLVPENATRGGFPLVVPAGTVQAIWIEIYVGRDLPAGRYAGLLLVAEDGRSHPLPVELEVFGFTLPDANSLHAMVYYDSEQPELYHGRNLDDVYHRFAHRQRVEFVHEYGVTRANDSLGRLRGGDFTPSRGYEGPGEGVGNAIVPYSFYAPGTDFDERDSAWRVSDEWMNFLAATLPQAITFLYLFDEPPPALFDHIRRIASNIKSNPGPGAALPLLVTHHYTRELEGAIDIWVSIPQHYHIGNAEMERARGRDHWTCNGARPESGAVVIDAPATDARMLAWACFKHSIKVYFYWHAVHWVHNQQKPGERRERVQNVWANPITFDNRGEPGKPLSSQGFGNGDGVLIYPGEDKLHADQDRGIAGPVSTVQMANLRRGLQDHLYLTIARDAGLADVVTDALQSVVPRVLSDSQGSVGFAQDGDTYEAARKRLATAIAAATR